MSMPTISSPLANFLFDLANVVLSVGAAAVLLGTLGVVWMGSVKERYSDERIAANEAKTATANAAAEQAREGASQAEERAGEANKEAARANERAGQLEKEAAEARERAATMEARVGELNLELARITTPRRLDEAMTASIVATCASFPGVSFELASTDGDPEARAFMVDVGNALLQSGWHLESWTGNTIKYPLSGGAYYGNTTNEGVVVALHTKSSERLSAPMQALTDALNKIGMKAKSEIADWKSLAEGGSSLSTDHIIILVGRK